MTFVLLERGLYLSRKDMVSIHSRSVSFANFLPTVSTKKTSWGPSTVRMSRIGVSSSSNRRLLGLNSLLCCFFFGGGHLGSSVCSVKARNLRGFGWFLGGMPGCSYLVLKRTTCFKMGPGPLLICKWSYGSPINGFINGYTAHPKN